MDSKYYFNGSLMDSENYPLYRVQKVLFIAYENPVTCCYSLLKQSEKLPLLWTPKTTPYDVQKLSYFIAACQHHGSIGKV